MNEETIVAMYDTPARAAAAEQDLLAANVPASAISRHASGSAASGGTAAAPSGGQREPGFWGKLFGGEPEHDSAVYDRSVENGASVLTVRVPGEHVESVSAILDRHNPVDIDERAASYGNPTLSRRETLGAGAPATAPDRALGGDEEVLALSEEQMTVGKRLVNRGTTRVRRYSVETPVQQDVTLHSETVSIERHPASSGAVAGDTAFKDRSIEVTETDEEAVIGKTTRVREEVVVHKQAADRVETVRDTVRREDVEVVREGGAQATGVGAATAPPGTAPASRPKV